MKDNDNKICPKCGERRILVKETETFDGPVRTYKCLKCDEF